MGSHWKYWHIITFDFHWFHLKVHGIDVYCQFILAGHAWCLGFRGIEGITVEVVGKTWENYWLVVFWFMRCPNVCQPKICHDGKTLNLIVCPLEISMIWGGGICQVHVMPMTSNDYYSWNVAQTVFIVSQGHQEGRTWHFFSHENMTENDGNQKSPNNHRSDF